MSNESSKPELSLEQKHIEQILHIFEYEKKHPVEPAIGHYGWTWKEAQIAPASITKLIVLGIVECTYSSHSTKEYVLTELGNSIAMDELEHQKSGTVNDKASPDSQDDFDNAENVFPPIETGGLFEDIIGYDDLKELFKIALVLPKPIHILMHGPPSVAKTMFLSDIERVAAGQCMWLVGSGTSKAGMWDGLIENKPKFLLIDELDKMNIKDCSALLSVMEKGRITRTKSGKEADVKLNTWVFASANRVESMAPELLSRFSKHQLREYTQTEYLKVVQAMLVRKEQLTPQMAAEVANALVGKTNDVRDAVRVARLAAKVGVKRATELLISY